MSFYQGLMESQGEGVPGRGQGNLSKRDRGADESRGRVPGCVDNGHFLDSHGVAAGLWKCEEVRAMC